MKQTPNYNLPQFEVGDKFNKETLNEGYSKIDLAISDLQETFNANATGSALTTQEVVEARKGKETLKDRIDGVEADVVSNKTQIGEVTEQLDNIANELTNLEHLEHLDLQEPEGKYTAWVAGGLFSDEEVGRIGLAYTSGAGHIANNKKVYFRRLGYDSINNSWGGRILIADRTGEGLGATVHACGKIKNGKYLAIVRYTNEANVAINTYLHWSDDRGLTWKTTGQWKDANGNTLNPQGEAFDIFITKTGRILTFYNDILNQWVVYSDDNGLTWQKSNLINNGYQILEGKFVQVKDDTIICVIRDSCNSNFIPSAKALYITSNDNGTTWADKKYSSSIFDMTANPCAITYDSENDVLELFWGSRNPRQDGYGSMYQSICTSEQAKQGNFGTPKRILQGTCTRDFGYVGAIKIDTKVFIGYYVGTSDNTRLKFMYGEKNKYNKSSSKLINYKNIYSNTPVIINNSDGSNSLNDVNEIRFSNIKNDVIPLMGRFYLTNPITIFDGVPTKNDNIIDIKSLIGNNYNTQIGGYYVNVEYGINSIANQSIQFLDNRATYNNVIQEGYFNDTAVRHESNRVIDILCAKKEERNVPIGGVRFILSNFATFTRLKITVLGFSLSAY